MKKIIIAFISVALMISGVYWFLQSRDHSNTDLQNNDKLHIVTTNSILEDMVKNVGQDRVEVYSIVKRGIDPHEYEPQPNDISKSNDADIIFHNGLNLETGGNGWFTKLVETAHKNFDKEVFSTSEDVEAKYLTTNKNEVDPHAWLDITNGVKYVKTITNVLKDKDPNNASFYQDNADKYVEKLERLHQSAQSKYLRIPEGQRLLVTSEGAFKYFGAAYHIRPVYIWEINTEAQGTPEQMKKVLKQINESEVKNLFVESSVSPKSMDKVAKESGLKIYAKIYTDSLAKKGTAGDTYYSMMKWNIDQIYNGLK